MRFRDALTSGQTLLMDGAMGTELIRRGFTAQVWRANLEAPDVVRAIYDDYMAAGAEVLVTNSFLMKPETSGDKSPWTESREPDPPREGDLETMGTRSPSLRASGSDVAISAIHGPTDIGRATVRIARSVGPRWLLGSIAPQAATGANFDNADALLATAHALHGVDGLLLETCSDASAFTAATWLRIRYPELPVLVSFTFAPNEAMNAWEWARLAQASDVAALGVNCGQEQAPADVGRVLGLFRAATTKPLFARPNAGTPKRAGDVWVYPRAPADWAAETGALCSQGLAMIGGCCGTTPEHIRALSSKMNEARFD